MDFSESNCLCKNNNYYEDKHKGAMFAAISRFWSVSSSKILKPMPSHTHFPRKTASSMRAGLMANPVIVYNLAAKVQKKFRNFALSLKPILL